MKHLFAYLLLCPILVFTQVSDDFSDGNFILNPEWTGNQDKFVVNDDLILQLKDSDAGLSVLTTPNSIAINCEWRIWVKLSFSPSSNNNARIYLITDNADISASLNGYFLQLGESGGDDAIELFRQSGADIVSVCRGTEGLISSSFELGLKITRDENSLWKIFADPNGGENYQFQTEATDNTYESTQYFGVYCKYTSSNSSKFYFDNIYVGEIIIDNQAPEILDIEVVSDSTLIVHFDEVLEQNSAENTLNYMVDNGIGNPESVELNNTNARQVILYFSNKFSDGLENTITVTDIEDLSGNAMTTQQLGFLFFEVAPYDVIINEIMADPTPVVDLPEYEYLELFNTLPHSVNLKDWKLQIGSSEKVFGNISVEAGGYLILAKENAANSFEPYGDFYGFSSFSLTNSGQDLILFSKEGIEISAVSYTDEWYKNYEKQDGGWSIELINPENICSGDENWIASSDVKGGSPGAVNSMDSDMLLMPKLSKYTMLDNKKIQLTFSQKMDSLSMTDLTHFMVDNQVGQANSIFYSGFKPRQIILTFSTDFQKGISYKMTLNGKIKNCRGDTMENDTIIVFGIPEEPEVMDIVINEILFNPLGDGVDFVELFNPSFKVIDIGSMHIGSVRKSPPNPPDTSFYSISDEQLLLIPGTYICLTSSPIKVKEQYFTQSPNAFSKVDPFPALNNDDGSVLLMSNDIFIDAFDYNEDMQYPLLVYVDGVSLERSSFMQATNDKTNWHSAAESVGFATPAYQNSQFIGDKEVDESIVVEPEIFSPDNDGYNDLLSIEYKFEQAGFMMTIDIYNSSGYPVRKLINNEYLGISGSVNWDGIQDDNTKAAVGIYVIFIEIFDLDGNVKQYKKTAVLASKL